MRILKKIYRWLNNPYISGLVAVVQISILLTLSWNWPKLPPQPPVTLNLLVLRSEVPYWSSLIQDFNKKNPDIHIQLGKGIDTTDNIEAIYTNAFQTNGSSVDIVYMDVIWLSRFAENGWLRDLDGEISEAELAEFLKDEVERGRYENKLYRIPFRTDVGVLFYRKDLLDKNLDKNKNQPPETFDDLLKISNDLQKSKLVDWGYLWQGQQYEGLVATFVEVLSGHGGYWIDDKKPDPDIVGLDRQSAINAVQFLRSLIVDHKVSPPFITSYTEENSLTEFKKGQAAFLRIWPDFWVKANTDDSPIKGKVGVTQIPAGVGYKSAGCLGGWGFGIAKNAQHPEEAWRAIKFFTSEEVQRKFVLESSYLPSRMALFNDPEMTKKYPYFEGMLQKVENAVDRPRIPQYNEASEILQKYLSAVLYNQLTPENAMEKAAQETRKLLEKN